MIAKCKIYLDKRRYTWRHDSILDLLAPILACVKNSIIYVDLPGSISFLTDDSTCTLQKVSVNHKHQRYIKSFNFDSLVFFIPLYCSYAKSYGVKFCIHGFDFTIMKVSDFKPRALKWINLRNSS